MSYIVAFLPLFLVHLIFVAIPGPDFFFVSQVALKNGKEAAFSALLGILSGVSFWLILAMLGLALVIQNHLWLHRILVIFGGVFLFYMGMNILIQSKKRPKNNVDIQIKSYKKSFFLKGLLTNLSNAKAIIYFTSIFVVFLPINSTISQRFFVVLILFVESFLWFYFVITSFSIPKIQAGYLKYSRIVDFCAGILFIFFASKILYSLYFF